MQQELTLSEVAGLAEKPISTVQSWMEQGLPNRKVGRNRLIRVADLVQWLACREFESGSQRDRLARVQADKFELDNATKRGELIYAWQVADSLNTMAAHLSAELDALPGRLANELAGISDAGEIRTHILRETRAVRASVARYVAQLAQAGEAVADDGDDMEPSAGEGSGSVGGREEGAAAGKRGAGSVAQ